MNAAGISSGSIHRDNFIFDDLDVAHWWLTKKAAVLAIELAHALIAIVSILRQFTRLPTHPSTSPSIETAWLAVVSRDTVRYGHCPDTLGRVPASTG